MSPKNLQPLHLSVNECDTMLHTHLKNNINCRISFQYFNLKFIFQRYFIFGGDLPSPITVNMDYGTGDSS